MRIERIIKRSLSMDKDIKGQFSLSYKSLQAQIATLFEDAGGKRVTGLLDALCNLNRCEQELVLDVFNKVIDRISHGEIRIKDDGNALREFEDMLYADLLAGMSEASEQPNKLKFQVLDGGLCKTTSAPKGSVVDIKELRSAKKTGVKPILN